jgi:LysM repeat protein
MRQQYLSVTCLLIGCLLTLVACTQSASVGIPTPDQAANATRSAFATASVAQPTNTPLPQPTDTPAPVQTVPATPTAEPAAVPTATAEAQPQPAPTPQAVAPADTSAGNYNAVCNQSIIYTVRPYDNLFRIALRFHTTINAIARRNGIYNVRVIHAGQRLRILTCAGW